jgi:hypothetical protein
MNTRKPVQKRPRALRVFHGHTPSVSCADLKQYVNLEFKDVKTARIEKCTIGKRAKHYTLHEKAHLVLATRACIAIGYFVDD